MSERDADVLVVGAGPTGLTATVGLARRGVDLRIVDKHPGRARHSNTLVMHARTLEVMDLIGIPDAFVGRGYAAPGIDMGSDADKPVRVEMHGPRVATEQDRPSGLREIGPATCYLAP